MEVVVVWILLFFCVVVVFKWFEFMEIFFGLVSKVVFVRFKGLLKVYVKEIIVFVVIFWLIGFG